MAIADDLKQLLTQPTRLEQLGIPASIITDLIYRLLFNEGEVNVGRFVEILRVHPQIVDQVLSELSHEHLVEVVRAGALRFSYTYRLTDEGGRRARDSVDRTQYVGPAPVDAEAYKRSVLLQTTNKQRVNQAQVKQALSHLILPESFHRKIGPAINAGSSLFLYGPPGNGKTTVAQAVAKLIANTEPIWIPYAICMGGQIIQVFDPLVHVPIKADPNDPQAARLNAGVDRRWGLFQRPSVMVGGELRMEALELRYEPVAKFYEAPLQLKANAGMFLIDDFGRQQMSPQELLNRWIVPLESGIDFLRLRSGQTMEVPFRQLIVFSTNLDPSELVDGAFLRRIQMKVEVAGPDEKTFRQIFIKVCQVFDVPFDEAGFNHILQKWYRDARRPIQSVHARDIIKTILSISDYTDSPPRLVPEMIDEACSSYFVDNHNAD
ncbi:MAG: AAA family ATPase [Anaerolineae bacterium]